METKYETKLTKDTQVLINENSLVKKDSSNQISTQSTEAGFVLHRMIQ